MRSDTPTDATKWSVSLVRYLVQAMLIVGSILAGAAIFQSGLLSGDPEAAMGVPLIVAIVLGLAIQIGTAKRAS